MALACEVLLTELDILGHLFLNQVDGPYCEMKECQTGWSKTWLKEGIGAS